MSKPSDNAPHAVIVGGGITGLAAAYYLRKKADEAGLPLRYTLLERAPELGGKIVSEEAGDFLIDGGPDCFITRKPWGVSLCRELGLGDDLIGTNDERRKTYVLSDGRLVPMPEGVMLIIPTRFLPFVTSPLISLPGKLRMGLDLFIPPRRDDGDETLASFIRRRLGQEALEKLAEPLLSGIYVTDPEHLSLKASFPRLLEIERKHGSLIKGMLAARRKAAEWRKKRSGPRLPMFVTLREGMEQLVEALDEELDNEAVHTNCAVTSIESLDAGGSPYRVRTDDGEALEADAVVLATPSNVSSRLVEGLDSELTEKLSTIRFVSTAVVSLGYRPQEGLPPLEGFGFIIPGTEGRRINACTWSSTKFDYRAPENHKLVRCFVGGPGHEERVDLDDEAMIQLVREELADIMNLRAEPDVVRVFRWRKANPQYDLGHLDRVERIRERARAHKGLVLAGNSYDGVGIPDCVRQAEEAVDSVMADLTE